MSQGNRGSGINFVPEYQASGLPWVLSGSATTSARALSFDHVSRAITVANNSAAGSYLLVGYSLNGVNGSRCFPLNGGQTQRFEVRVKELWLKGQNSTIDFGVHAELTTIPASQMLSLTGSNASQNELTGSLQWQGAG